MFNIGYTAGGRFDPPFMPTMTDPLIEGGRLEINGAIQTVTDDFIASEDFEMLAIALGVSEYQPRDKWTFSINGVPKCRNISVKNVPEEIYFGVIIPIKAGDILTLSFSNEGGRPSYVWFNYHLLREGDN